VHLVLDKDVFGPSGPPLGAERVRVDRSGPAHAHGFTEIALVAAGEAVHRSAVGERRVRRGDVLVVHPGEWHAYEDPASLEVWNVYLGQNATRDLLLTGARRDPVLPALFWGAGLVVGSLDVPAVATAEAEAAMLARSRATIGAGPGQIASLLGHLLVLLGSLGGLLGSGTARPPHPLAIETIRLFEDSLAEDWSLEQLGHALAVSPAHLSRLVRAETGLPPMRYLAKRRAEEMARLLIETDDPLSVIGPRVGWADPNYASRRFRMLEGLSPSEYRRAFRPNKPQSRGVSP